MGWARGSELMSQIIKAVQKHVPDEKLRRKLYLPIIEAFDDHDWDTHDECEGEDDAFDAALNDRS